MLQLLNEIRFPNTNEPIGADHFVRKWLNHIEDFSGRRSEISLVVCSSHFSELMMKASMTDASV